MKRKPAAEAAMPATVRKIRAAVYGNWRRRCDSVQAVAGDEPRGHASDLYVFRCKRGSLIKIVWHDGLGVALYARCLERSRRIWPAAVYGAVAISSAQPAYVLDGIDWRNAQHTWRPQAVG